MKPRLVRILLIASSVAAAAGSEMACQHAAPVESERATLRTVELTSFRMPDAGGPFEVPKPVSGGGWQAQGPVDRDWSHFSPTFGEANPQWGHLNVPP